MLRVVLCSMMWEASALTPTLEDLLPSSCTESTLPETCFGAQGKKCERVPGLDLCPLGQQAVSAGSLAHDACCFECPNEGIACSDDAPEPWNPESLNNSEPCALEWRKAGWNGLDARYWCVKFDSKTSDVTVIDGARKFDTPNYGGTLNVSLLLRNRVSTAGLCAPADTRMDCIGCSRCTDCAKGIEDCASNCAKGIGDSDICCSGRFSKVVVEGLGGTPLSKTYGKCAATAQTDMVAV